MTTYTIRSGADTGRIDQILCEQGSTVRSHDPQAQHTRTVRVQRGTFSHYPCSDDDFYVVTSGGASFFVAKNDVISIHGETGEELWPNGAYGSQARQPTMPTGPETPTRFSIIFKEGAKTPKQLPIAGISTSTAAEPIMSRRFNKQALHCYGGLIKG